MQERIILHLDMDAFFASVEIVRNPALKNKPVVVGGNPEKRGVVSTCSYEARKYGIHSAMSLYEAKRRCPHAIFLEGDFHLYRSYSEQIMAILHTFSSCVEVVSIDEAYLDVSDIAYPYGGRILLGRAIREAIFQQTKLTCSVGIGVNKLIAKIAASQVKPNGLNNIEPGNEITFLAPLPVQCLPGIGSKTKEMLNHDGIRTIADLQSLALDHLIQRYGSHGYHFYLAAHGRDSRPVVSEDQQPKSIGAETTFDVDHNNIDFLKETLNELVGRTHRRLHKTQMRAKGVSLKLRFNDFHTITRSKVLEGHTNDLEIILQEIYFLFHKNYDGKIPLRLIGITLEKLTDGYWQPTIWDWQKEQERLLHQ